MASPLRFQDFSLNSTAADETSDIAEQIANAYREGHEAGVKAGTEASALVHAESQDRLRAELIEALRDHHQDRVAVQAQVLSGVAPLLGAVIRQLTPYLAAVGLPEQVSAAVQTALETRPDAKPLIRCAEEAVPGLQPALAKWSGAFDLQIDSRLTPHEVQLHWDDGFDTLNLDKVVDAALAALEELFQSPEVRKNGTDLTSPEPAKAQEG